MDGIMYNLKHIHEYYTCSLQAGATWKKVAVTVGYMELYSGYFKSDLTPKNLLNSYGKCIYFGPHSGNSYLLQFQMKQPVFWLR